MGLPNQYSLYIQSVALLFYLQSTVCNGRVIINSGDVYLLSMPRAQKGTFVMWCWLFHQTGSCSLCGHILQKSRGHVCDARFKQPSHTPPPQPYPFRLYYQSTTVGVSCVTYRLTLKAPLILAPLPACTRTFLYSTCWQQIPVYCQENSSCCWLCLTEQHWLCACMFSKYACGV